MAVLLLTLKEVIQFIHIASGPLRTLLEERRSDWNSDSSFPKTHPPFALAKGKCLKLPSYYPRKAQEFLAYFKMQLQLSAFQNVSTSLMQTPGQMEMTSLYNIQLSSEKKGEKGIPKYLRVQIVVNSLNNQFPHFSGILLLILMFWRLTYFFLCLLLRLVNLVVQGNCKCNNFFNYLQLVVLTMGITIR